MKEGTTLAGPKTGGRYGNRQVQGDVTLKFGSRCVYGEDIREKIVPRPIERYVWHWMTNPPLRFMLDVTRKGEARKYPLQYPKPERRFTGTTVNQ